MSQRSSRSFSRVTQAKSGVWTCLTFPSGFYSEKSEFSSDREGSSFPSLVPSSAFNRCLRGALQSSNCTENASSSLLTQPPRPCQGRVHREEERDSSLISSTSLSVFALFYFPAPLCLQQKAGRGCPSCPHPPRGSAAHEEGTIPPL